ncbi:replicative DNA helicase [Streptomyces sp. ME02-6979.5a]|uniref:replicative DNA helicase n=1 Tax=unclassified Streptomyces TaxID=2593676 RepID=UPI0029A2D2C9|nr:MULTISPECIES: replicative DNA helicase [unclassified Streptomyces]MDX3343730.1 replicative DNA helicase [Streptomyces sp. ME02-6979.5a]MDX5526198.1 replicative DNA helicase [Streptomyces sp. DE06-01C]
MTTVPNDDTAFIPTQGGADHRVPPSDLDAESWVLASMLMDNDIISDVAAILKGGSDFYRPNNEAIYNGILALFAKGEPVDPIQLGKHLTQTGDLARIGGAPYLHGLIQGGYSPASATFHAEIIRETAVLRELGKACREVEAMTYARQAETKEICDTAQARIFAATEERSAAGDNRVPLGSIMEGVFDELERNGQAGADITGIATGITDLDALTQGLQPGQLIVVAGRPAMGKTMLALNFARRCSIKDGDPSLFFSLEMGKNELGMRLLSAEARIALHHMRSGTMTDEDWTRAAKHTPAINAAPLYIDDTANQTVMYIRTQARKQKAQTGLSLIVVDYLQLMQSGTKSESRQAEVADISRNLKLLAKELEVPIVALSQLNRGPEHRTDKKPVVSDLRESGAIEQDADMVILLHREDVYEKESPRGGEIDLIVGKHRNGPTATITGAFQGHYCRIVDMAQT